MAQTSAKSLSTAFRIDIPCERTGFSTPPFDVHIKFLPADGAWTLVAHAAAGKPDALARWLRPHIGIDRVRVAPGIAPTVLRARAPALPKEWAAVASLVTVHHLDLGTDGSASWFVDGTRERIQELVHSLGLSPGPGWGAREVRGRPVYDLPSDSPISRRQFEALASAVALGYYEIPHRVDLRAIALLSGISLGSLSELLRRAETAVLTQYVDAHLMKWPDIAAEVVISPLRPVRPLVLR